MAGDVVEITVTFNEPVGYADLTFNDYPVPTVILMESDSGAISDTVWCGTYLVLDGINDAVDVTVCGRTLLGEEVTATDAYAFVVDNEAPRFKIIEPDVAVNTDCVLFNFNAFDKLVTQLLMPSGSTMSRQKQGL